MRWLPWRRTTPAPTLASLRTAGFVAIDLETTGPDARRDLIVSLAAVPFVDGMPQAPHTTLVNPGRPIPAESTRIHGITDAMVASAPSPPVALERFDAVCADRVIVGHAVGFDLAVLARARRAAGRPTVVRPALDTMRLAVAFARDLREYSLETVADRFAVEIVGRHTAQGDAVAAGQILLAMLKGAEGRGYATVSDLIRLQQTVVLPR